MYCIHLNPAYRYLPIQKTVNILIFIDEATLGSKYNYSLYSLIMMNIFPEGE